MNRRATDKSHLDWQAIEARATRQALGKDELPRTMKDLATRVTSWYNIRDKIYCETFMELYRQLPRAPLEEIAARARDATSTALKEVENI